MYPGVLIPQDVEPEIFVRLVMTECVDLGGPGRRDVGMSRPDDEMYAHGDKHAAARRVDDVDQ